MTLQFNKELHQYTKGGKVYTSVTQYINKFKKPFDKDYLSVMCAARDDREVEDVLKEWEMKADISKNFGNAIHESIELFIKYKQKPKHLFLKQVVDEFEELTKGLDLHAEKVIHDDELELAGTIDLIVKVGEKKVKLIDYKTNGEFTLKGKEKLLPPYDYLRANHLDTYSLQLNIYKHLLERKGYEVVGMELWHYDNKFNIIKAKELNINI